jgi:hypothetical protein
MLIVRPASSTRTEATIKAPSANRITRNKHRGEDGRPALRAIDRIERLPDEAFEIIGHVLAAAVRTSVIVRGTLPNVPEGASVKRRRIDPRRGRVSRRRRAGPRSCRSSPG